MSTMMLLALLPLTVAAILWTIQKPARVLGLYAAVIPFGSAFALPIGLPRSFSTLSSILGILTVVALTLGLVRRRLHNPPTLATSLWLLLLSLTAASIAWSIRPSATIDNVFVLGSLMVTYILVALYPFDRNDLTFIANSIVIGTALTGAYGIALALTSNLPKTGAGLARFEVTGAGGGRGGDPNITAAALVLGFAIALRNTLQPDISRLARAGYLAATILTAIGIVLTVSRGGLLAVVIVIVVTVVKQRRGAIPVLILGLLMVPAVLYLIPDTVSERADNTGSSGRTEIWAIALESCPEYCATGSGFGTFPDVHEQGLLTTPDTTGTKLRFQAHSIWLSSLVEVGVLGLLLIVGALVALGWDLWRVPTRLREGALAGLIGLVITSSFLSALAFKYFWLVIMYGTIVVNVHRMWDRKTSANSLTAADTLRHVDSEPNG